MTLQNKVSERDIILVSALQYETMSKHFVVVGHEEPLSSDKVISTLSNQIPRRQAPQKFQVKKQD